MYCMVSLSIYGCMYMRSVFMLCCTQLRVYDSEPLPGMITSKQTKASILHPVLSMWWRHCQHSHRSLFIAALIMHEWKSPPQSAWGIFTEPDGSTLLTQQRAAASVWLWTAMQYWSAVQWSECYAVSGTEAWHILISRLFSLQGHSEEFSSFIASVWGSNRNRLFQTGKICPPPNCIIQSNAPSMSHGADPNPVFSLQMSTIESGQPKEIRPRGQTTEWC